MDTALNIASSSIFKIRTGDIIRYSDEEDGSVARGQIVLVVGTFPSARLIVMPEEGQYSRVVLCHQILDDS